MVHRVKVQLVAVVGRGRVSVLARSRPAIASPGFHPRCNSTGYLVSFIATKPIFTRPAWLHPREFRTEALAGLVVAIALIPEAISF